LNRDLGGRAIALWRGERNGLSAGHAEAAGGCVAGAQKQRAKNTRIAFAPQTPIRVLRPPALGCPRWLPDKAHCDDTTPLIVPIKDCTPLARWYGPLGAFPGVISQLARPEPIPRGAFISGRLGLSRLPDDLRQVAAGQDREEAGRYLPFAIVSADMNIRTTLTDLARLHHVLATVINRAALTGSMTRRF
jgi:hypothetical protein